MHGFFIDLRLYQKAKSIANPFDYVNFKKAKVQSKIEKERETRIRASKNLPKVNKELAAKLLSSGKSSKMADSSDEDEESFSDEGGKNLSSKQRSKLLPRANATAENPLGDDRFADAFKDEDFAVDVNDPEYALHYPVESKKAVAARMEADFEKVDTEDESEEEGRPFDASSSDEDMHNDVVKKKKGPKSENSSRPTFYQVKDGRMAKIGSQSRNNDAEGKKSLPFKELLKKSDSNQTVRLDRKSKNASITFKSKKSDKQEDGSDTAEPAHSKRGVGPLGLSSQERGKRGRGGGRGGRGQRGRGHRGGGRGRR